MSTNSTINIQNEDGTVDSIYCHWDGYLEFNGKLLQQHYTSCLLYTSPSPRD